MHLFNLINYTRNLNMNGHHAEHSTSAGLHKKVLLNKELSTQILSQLNECRLEKRFTDAILSVDQEELHCHRCVLAASSPYFQATFSSQFQEAINAHVTLHDISPWIMKRILDYIYSGTLEITLENATDYLRTGHMLHYPAIVDACCELLSQHLHPSNCLGVKEFASLYRCSDLEMSAYNFALEHFNSVVEKSEELSKLSADSLIKYLSADNVDITNEAVMWRAIHNWVYFDVDKRKKYLYELLECVRLPVLTPKELSVISNEPLIRSQPKCVQLLEKVHRVGDKIKTPSINTSAQPDKLLSTESLKLMGYQRGARPSTLPRDVIVLFGGCSDYELTDMVAYDPLKERWNDLPTPPENIVRASITSYRDTIFLTGGIVNNLLSKTLWIFCCKEKRWTRGKSLCEARAKHSSVAMNGVLYLSGGVHMDEDQSVVPMTEIHSYDIKTGVWKRVGCNNTAKQESTLLGFNDILYELGGQTDGAYTCTMETYEISSDGLVTGTAEHYVLPCTGSPGPLRAALDETDLITILWENTGDLFTLNTNDRRFYRVTHALPSLSGSLVAFNHHAYILGGVEDGKPCSEGRVLGLTTPSYGNISLPADIIVHKCVHVRM